MSSNVETILNQISNYMYEEDYKDINPHRQYRVRSQARREGYL